MNWHSFVGGLIFASAFWCFAFALVCEWLRRGLIEDSR